MTSRKFILLVYSDKRGRLSYLINAFHVTALAGLEKTDVILRCKSLEAPLALICPGISTLEACRERQVICDPIECSDGN